MEPITVSLTTDELLYIAKIYEQTERYEDMADTMRKLIAHKQELNVEERNLFFVAYKKCVGPCRAAWRTISSIEQKEEAQGSKHLAVLDQLKKKIESELESYCNEVLELLDEILIKNTNDAEGRVFFYLMKGDYYRFIAEYASEAGRNKAKQQVLENYQHGLEISEKELVSTTHPTRLKLALNFSVFYHDILNDPHKARDLAQRAFDEAIAKIDEIHDDLFKDSIMEIGLIREYLTLWAAEVQQDR